MKTTNNNTGNRQFKIRTPSNNIHVVSMTDKFTDNGIKYTVVAFSTNKLWLTINDTMALVDVPLLGNHKTSSWWWCEPDATTTPDVTTTPDAVTKPLSMTMTQIADTLRHRICTIIPNVKINHSLDLSGHHKTENALKELNTINTLVMDFENQLHPDDDSKFEFEFRKLVYGYVSETFSLTQCRIGHTITMNDGTDSMPENQRTATVVAIGIDFIDVMWTQYCDDVFRLTLDELKQRASNKWTFEINVFGS